MNCVLVFLAIYLWCGVDTATLTRDEDALIVKLLDSIEKKEVEVPRLGKREIPRLGREIELVPRLGREFDMVPRLGREVDEVPRLGREIHEVPRIGRELEVPRLGREVPRLGREAEEVPRIGREMVEVPRLGREIDEVPRLGREVPRLGREMEVPRLGREVPRLGKREVPRLGKREVPRLGRREASSNDLKSLYNQLKREVSNDLIQAEIKEEKRVLKAFDLGTRGLILKKIKDKIDQDGFSDQKKDIEARNINRPFLHVKRTDLLSLIEKLASETKE